jgi:UDP-N-acetyl-D-mannosaminuronate dehydrogenase
VPSLDDERTGVRESVALTPSLLGRADLVLILTDHSCFDVDGIVASSRVLVDARNATAGTPTQPASRHGLGWIVKGGLA